MKNVRKFKGIRFNPELSSIAECIAPPYDVFDYGDSTYGRLKGYKNNIVNIQKPEGEGNAKYAAAAEIFKKYISSRLLIQDSEPGIYIVNQDWRTGSRTGLIAAVKIDSEYTRIRRHEKTKTGPIIDRFKLTKATGLNIGCI